MSAFEGTCIAYGQEEISRLGDGSKDWARSGGGLIGGGGAAGRHGVTVPCPGGANLREGVKKGGRAGKGGWIWNKGAIGSSYLWTRPHAYENP